ncbi:MAG: HAMP domain-containing protein [Trueperaceae bacterium]|nr:HAMP domain-containing protein [Trueperaceae bacterium]
MTLRLRLTIFFSAFMALILSGVAVSVYVLTDQSLATAVEERARQALTDLSRGSLVTGLQQLPGDAYYQIILLGAVDADIGVGTDIRSGVNYVVPGRANPTNVRLAEVVPEVTVQELLSTGAAAGYATLPRGERLRVLGELTIVEFPVQEARVTAAVLVGLPASSTEAALAQLAQDLGLTVVLAFLAFALGVWLLSRQVLSPLQRVTQAASRVSSRDLSQRVPVPSSQDEMHELAVALNHMLDRLQESFETQRRFTADASHELRTPVTAIVGHANYVLRRTRPNPEQIDSLNVIRHEADRMGKLVNDLLELARADAGFSIEKEPMNLLEVVEAVRAEYGPVADGATITIDCATPLVEVEGDSTRLKQVVLNLVQNAVNAGASHVTLHLATEGRTVRLEVLDDGPGIPSEAIPHLFDRFFRVDGARSSRGNGSGLGLAIVRWIVQQHGGTVAVTSKSAEGSVFVVSLPALNPKSTEVGRSPRTAAPETVAARR